MLLVALSPTGRRAAAAHLARRRAGNPDPSPNSNPSPSPDPNPTPNPNPNPNVVQGLNQAELEANVQATERLVCDLNTNPALPFADGSFDLVTNVRAFPLDAGHAAPMHPNLPPYASGPQPYER